MNQQNITVMIITLMVGMLCGGYLVYRYKPRTVTQEKIVTQNTVQDHIVTVIKTVKEPAGTVTTTETVTDTTVHTNSAVDTKTKAPLWHVSLGAATGISFVPEYHAQVERRLAGPLFVGASASTNGTLGISMGIEF